MSVRMRQQPDHQGGSTSKGGGDKVMWVGPTPPDQKPKTCNHCGKPIMRAYRVYEQKIDQYGNKRVTRGQYETAHLFDGVPVFDACPFPSLLEQYQDKIRREQEARDNHSTSYVGSSVTSGGTALKRTIHLETQTAGGGVRVKCGAKGSLWTSLDTELVTCSNCVTRIEQDNSKYGPGQGQMKTSNSSNNNSSNNDQSTKDTDNMSAQEQTTTANTSKTAMTKDQIKQKIADAKAKKAAGGTAGTVPAGASATITAQATDDAPMPQATQTKKEVKRQQVQAAKADKGPKLLNLCGCGCGTAVKANFAPGHDARLHGWVKKLAAGVMSLSEIPGSVKDGMYPKVKQSSVKDGEGKVTLQGVNPAVQESEYLKLLVGKGGVAQ